MIRIISRIRLLSLGILLVGSACTHERDSNGLYPGGAGGGNDADDGSDGGDGADGGTGADDGDGGEDGDGGDDDGDGGGIKFDTPVGDGDTTKCEVPDHVPCDQGTDDVFSAMGLGCPGEVSVTSSVSGHPGAMGVIKQFGNTSEWDPREGTAMAVIGSGFVDRLFEETPDDDSDSCPTYCNNDVSNEGVEGCADEVVTQLGMYDPGSSLPVPLRVNNVGGDCTTNPSLVGTGDCSNTISGQFNQGREAHDYTEMRVVTTVPEGVDAISYDFAFFSTEYPVYYGQRYNDMYVAWLESESWTGNISFDEAGNPISLNAGFLDFKDNGGTLPEFEGTCMRQHAATKWLQTTAPVTAGEEIVVVFAVFDLADSILDSYAIIDNWRWECSDDDRPDTIPVG